MRKKKSPATTEKEKKSKWTILFYDASQQNTLKNIWSFCVWQFDWQGYQLGNSSFYQLFRVQYKYFICLLLKYYYRFKCMAISPLFSLNCISIYVVFSKRRPKMSVEAGCPNFPIVFQLFLVIFNEKDNSSSGADQDLFLSLWQGSSKFS